MVNANPLSISLHGIPDYVGFYSLILSSAVLRNSPEYLAVSHSRVTEPSVNQISTPNWHRNRRSLPPFPTISTITQWFCRVCR
jgi:hypothetical protein